MNETEKRILEEIAIIQEIAVSTIYKQNLNSYEELAYSISYDAIVMLMELLDGYRGHFNLELVDKSTSSILFEKIELHDKVIDYLKE